MASYYITGVSGTGKSTTAKALQKEGFNVYDLDSVKGICHWRHKETKEKAEYYFGIGKDWIDAHEYICDEAKLREILETSSGDNIVLGITANQENLFPIFAKIFLLYCSEETFLHRLSTRDEGNYFGKEKSEQEQILSWYKSFQDRMISQGAIPISTEDSTEEVVKNILLEIRKG